MDEANIPRIWLMSDERMGDALFDVLRRLPLGTGVVFRHHSLHDSEREALGQRVADTCRARRLVLAVSRDVSLARKLGAAMVHNPSGDQGHLAHSRAVHSLGEARAAAADGAGLIFVSPLFATRSHEDKAPLDRQTVRSILAASECPAIALGGMNAQRFSEVERLGFYGWAGIDAWL